MTDQPSVDEVFESVSDAVRPIRDRLHGALMSVDDNLVLFDDELGAPASDCVHLQAAASLDLYSHLRGGPGDSAVAKSLRATVLSRHSEPDWFAIPYNAPKGTRGEFDAVEIGASCLGWLSADLEEESSELGRRAAERLASCRDAESSGRISKSDSSSGLEILNTQAYAEFALRVADGITGNNEYRLLREDIASRLNRSVEPYDDFAWPYALGPDGEVKIGYSLAYQATIVAYVDLSRKVASLLGNKPPILPNLDKGAERVFDDFQKGPEVVAEDTSWTRDWDSVWEIQLMRYFRGSGQVRRDILQALKEIPSKGGSGTATKGRGAVGAGGSAQRNPTRTTLRRIANYSYLLRALCMYVIMESAPKLPELYNHPLVQIKGGRQFSFRDIQKIQAGNIMPLTAEGQEIACCVAGDNSIRIRGRVLARNPHARTALIYARGTTASPVEGFTYSSTVGGYYRYLDLHPVTGVFDESIHLPSEMSAVSWYIRSWRPGGEVFIEYVY